MHAMASFSPPIPPESLENVLHSLERLLDHNQQHTQHVLYNTRAPHYVVHEPFSNQLAEQYDDPLVLEETPPSPVHEVVQVNIPVLKNVVHPTHKLEIRTSTNASNMKETLNELRAELNDIVADIMLDAREQLEQQDADSQEIMKTSLKQFLHDLTTRLPQ